MFNAPDSQFDNDLVANAKATAVAPTVNNIGDIFTDQVKQSALSTPYYHGVESRATLDGDLNKVNQLGEDSDQFKDILDLHAKTLSNEPMSADDINRYVDLSKKWDTISANNPQAGINSIPDLYSTLASTYKDAYTKTTQDWQNLKGFIPTLAYGAGSMVGYTADPIHALSFLAPLGLGTSVATKLLSSGAMLGTLSAALTPYDLASEQTQAIATGQKPQSLKEALVSNTLTGTVAGVGLEGLGLAVGAAGKAVLERYLKGANKGPLTPELVTAAAKVEDGIDKGTIKETPELRGTLNDTYNALDLIKDKPDNVTQTQWVNSFTKNADSTFKAQDVPSFDEIERLKEAYKHPIGEEQSSVKFDSSNYTSEEIAAMPKNKFGTPDIDAYEKSLGIDTADTWVPKSLTDSTKDSMLGESKSTAEPQKPLNPVDQALATARDTKDTTPIAFTDAKGNTVEQPLHQVAASIAKDQKSIDLLKQCMIGDSNVT